MNIFTTILKKLISLIMTFILVVGVTFIVLYLVGIVPYVVVSGSMEPTIQTGSLCFINKHAAYSSIRVNDIIAYRAPTGANVTHRVVRITSEGFETQGDKNNTSDGFSTNQNNFLGKNVFSIPKLGYAVREMQTTTGRIIVVTTAIVILAASFLMDDTKRKSRIEST